MDQSLYHGDCAISAAFIGFDLAKSVFQVHGVDINRKVVVMKRLRRDAVLAFFANLTPCVVGVEACAELHFGQEIARLATGAVRQPRWHVLSNPAHHRVQARAICSAVFSGG
jgi:transposase